MIISILQNFILADFDPLKPISPVPVYTFLVDHLCIVFSNHMFMVMLAAFILAVLFSAFSHPERLVPKGFQNLIESVCVFLRDKMAKPILGESTDDYLAFIWTIFFFILTLNLLGLVPLESIIYLISKKPNNLAGSATANIWVTGGLATITFFTVHISGIKKQGLWHYIKNFAPPVPWPMIPIIYPLEIITAFVRPFALAIRLFANMLAGHMVLGTFLALILIFKNYGVAATSIGADVALSFLELLIAFIQAYIFAFLSTLFISFSISGEH